MAEAPGAVLSIRELYDKGKGVYDSLQAVTDNFKGSAKPLLDQLKLVVSQLEHYKKREEDGSISFRKTDGQFNYVGAAAEQLKERINEAENFVYTVSQSSGQRPRKFTKFYQNLDIEQEFDTLKNKLHVASNELRSALLPYQMQTNKGNGPPGAQRKRTISDISDNKMPDSWDRPESGGGSLDTGYYVERKQSPGVDWTRVTTEPILETTITAEDLTEKMRVIAVNTAGIGYVSDSFDGIVTYDATGKTSSTINFQSYEALRKTTDSDFTDVVQELLPDQLKNLYDELSNVSYKDVEKKEQSAGKDVDQQAKAVLRLWRERNGKNATRKVLLEALYKCKYKLAVENLIKIWMIPDPFVQDNQDNIDQGVQQGGLSSHGLMGGDDLPLDDEFKDVIRQLDNDELEHFYYALNGITHAQVKKAKLASSTQDVNLQAMCVLRRWREYNGKDNATKDALLLALKKCDFINTMDNVKRKWNLQQLEPGSDGQERLVQLIGNKLKQHYRDDLCKKPVYPWIPGDFVDLDSIYVPVTIDIRITGARVIKQRVESYQELFKNGVRYVLTGNPGQGKSCFCAKLAYDWCEKTTLQDIRLLFVLNLGLMDHTSNIEGEICRQLLDSTDLSIDSDTLRKVIKDLGPSLLVILDAADEALPSLFKMREQYITGNVIKTMKKKHLENACVLVTTRPWREREIIQFKVYERLELKQMSTLDVTKFIDKFFNQNKTDVISVALGKKLLEYIDKNKLTMDTSTPLVNLLVCWYWIKTEGFRGIPSRVGELYNEIITIMYKDCEQHTSGMDELIANRLGQIGISGLQVNSTTLVFPKEDIESVCGAEGLEQACSMGIVCKKGNDYQFFHKSGQEFCAGVYLAKNHQDKLSDYLSKINTVWDAQNLGMVLKFAAAKNIEAADKIVERLVDIFCMDVNCQKYYEKKDECDRVVLLPLLQFDELLTVQQFIELCLECNYEADAESRYVDTLGKLFELPASVRDSMTESELEGQRVERVMLYGEDNGQRVMLYGVAAKTAITLGYYMKQSDINITRLDLHPSAHVTNIIGDGGPQDDLGPATELFEKARASMYAIDIPKLEGICDTFIASHPELNQYWKKNRTEYVCRIEAAKSEEDKTRYQIYHRQSLASLAGYIACIQQAPHLPSVSETDLSPVVESLPYIDIRELWLTKGYYAMMRGDVITRLVSVLGKCASLRVLDASELHHWDMRQKRDLCQAICGMRNLTVLNLAGNELDSTCQRQLVISFDKFSRQGTASLKELALYETRLDKNMLVCMLDACRKMRTVKELTLDKHCLPDGVTRADFKEKYNFVVWY